MNPNHVLESAFERGQKYFNWLDTLHGPLERPLVETVEKTCGLIWDRKGKRLRCHFVYWFSEPYQIPSTTLELYSWAVEAIHTATLLHDDVIDKAEMRRAGPSANNVFDNTIPVLSGDYLMSDAIHQLALKGSPELLKSMCLALKKLSQGEILQYQNQFKISETEDFYRLVCDLKTASLLNWAASVGPTLADSKDKLHALNFANAYGLLYQFTDDILDIRGTHSKSIGQDLNEGKLNWAAWKLTQNDPELKKSVKKAFSEQKITPELSEHLSESYNRKSQQKLLKLNLLEAQQTCLNSVQLLSSDYLRQLLTTLVEFTLSRVF